MLLEGPVQRLALPPFLKIRAFQSHGARFPGDGCRVVAAVVGDHHHFVVRLRVSKYVELPDHISEKKFLVVGGNHDHEAVFRDPFPPVDP